MKGGETIKEYLSDFTELRNRYRGRRDAEAVFCRRTHIEPVATSNAEKLWLVGRYDQRGIPSEKTEENRQFGTREKFKRFGNTEGLAGVLRTLLQVEGMGWSKVIAGDPSIPRREQNVVLEFPWKTIKTLDRKERNGSRWSVSHSSPRRVCSSSSKAAESFVKRWPEGRQIDQSMRSENPR